MKTVPGSGLLNSDSFFNGILITDISIDYFNYLLEISIIILLETLIFIL